MVKYFRVKKSDYDEFKALYQKYKPNTKVTIDGEHNDYGYYRVKVTRKYKTKSDDYFGVKMDWGHHSSDVRESFADMARRMTEAGRRGYTIGRDEPGIEPETIPIPEAGSSPPITRVRYDRDDEGNITVVAVPNDTEPEPNPDPDEDEHRTIRCSCGYINFMSPDRGMVCGRCGNRLRDVVVEPVEPPEPLIIECSECGTLYHNESRECPDCRSNVVVEPDGVSPVVHRCRGCGYVHYPRDDRICPRCHCNIGDSEPVNDRREYVRCSHCNHLTRMYPGRWFCPNCNTNNEG